MTYILILRKINIISTIDSPPSGGRIMAVLVLKSITSHLLSVVTLRKPVNKYKVSA